MSQRIESGARVAVMSKTYEEIDLNTTQVRRSAPTGTVGTVMNVWEQQSEAYTGLYVTVELIARVHFEDGFYANVNVRALVRTHASRRRPLSTAELHASQRQASSAQPIHRRPAQPLSETP